MLAPKNERTMASFLAHPLAAMFNVILIRVSECNAVLQRSHADLWQTLGSGTKKLTFYKLICLRRMYKLRVESWADHRTAALATLKIETNRFHAIFRTM